MVCSPELSSKVWTNSIFFKKKIITNTTHANKPVGYCMSKLCRKNSKNSAMNKTLLLHFYYINVNFLPLTIFLNNVLQLQ